ncbi:MAG: hypothetical protein U5L95_01380 [Candidatus Saccharibacteria bacterium]|nr:hypothetical protein [Candidatus Saccharibacteria bacterium]
MTVTYEDSQNVKETNKLYIDFAAIPDYNIGEPEDAKARKALEKIAKEISSLTAQVKSHR